MKPLQEFYYFTQYSKFKIFLNLDILALGKFDDTANRRTDHAITKWLRTKGQISIDKILHVHRKLKPTRTHENQWWTQVTRKCEECLILQCNLWISALYSNRYVLGLVWSALCNCQQYTINITKPEYQEIMTVLQHVKLYQSCIEYSLELAGIYS